MAKVDDNRDYYAELSLAPGADISEINKQYRKLALKYHPDRNPGKEAEYNAKFQNIKSAQEVLTDPIQRARYDAERARVGRGVGYMPPRTPGVPSRNPYQATSNFPPPPSRTNPRPSYASTPSSGANRYQNVPKPTATGGGGRDEARSRANAFRAFEQMNKPSGQTPRPPTAARPGQKPVPPPREPQGKNAAPRPRSGWESVDSTTSPGMQRTQSTRATRKAGFGSSSPTTQEPTVSPSSSFFASFRSGHRSNAARSQPEMPPPPGPPPIPKRNKVPDPLKEFRAQNADLASPSPRVRTPYATSGGEKTYFSSGELGRSSTVKFSSSSGHGQPERHRSASPPRNRGYDPRTASGYRTGPSSPERATPQRHRSEAGISGEPRAGPSKVQESRSRTPAGSNSSGDDQVRSEGDSPTFMERLARDRREKDRRARKAHHTRVYPTYDPSSTTTSNGSDHAHAGPPPHSSPRPPRGPPPTFADPWTAAGSSHEAAEKDKNGSSTTYAHCHLPPAHFRSPRRSTPSQKSKRAQTDIESGLDKPSPDESKSSALPASPCITSREFKRRREAGLWSEWRVKGFQAKQSAHPRFSFAVNDESFIPTKPSPPDSGRPKAATGADPIDTDFAAADFDGKFTASSGGASTGSRGPPGYFDSGTRSPGRRVSPDRPDRPDAGRQGVPPMPPPKEPSPAVSPGQATFRPEDWAHEKYVWDPMAHAPASPLRGNSLHSKRSEPRLKHGRSRAPSKTNAAKRVPVGKPATVSDAPEEPKFSAEAVEVIPKDGELGVGNSETNGTDPVDGNAMDIDLSSPPHSQPAISSGLHPGPSSEPSKTPHPNLSPQASHSTSTSTSTTNFTHIDLDALRNVEPFAPTPKFGQSGMLNDLASSLPFDSRPSAHVPVPPTDSISDAASSDDDHTIPGVTPQPLSLPPVPRAPAVPKLLSTTAWDLYLTNVQAYISEWIAFNDKMLGHFNDRQRAVKIGLALTTPDGCNWLGIRGEGESGGYLKYMTGLEEDVRVRQHWDVAWERHREAMRLFGKVRAKIVEAF